MNRDRRDRIREHIETLNSIKESLQDLLTEEKRAWDNTPRTLKTATRYMEHLGIVAGFRDAIWHTEYDANELDALLRM